MKTFRSIAVISLLLLLATPATAQNGQTTGSSSTAQATEAAKDINRPFRDKWALVIGIGEFANDSVPKLKYATKDARDFYNYLIKEANFAPDHVRMLLNEQATERRILSELGNKFLARLVKPDDLIVLFFSTHGSPSQLDIRGKNFIVAYDTDPQDLYASGIEMQQIMDAVGDRVLTDRVLLVLDACHSGSVSPNAKGMHRTGNFDAESISQGSGQMVICSSSTEQQSWESKRYENGVFTKNLLDALRENNKQTPITDAFNSMSEKVKSEVREDYPGMRQDPVLHSKWKGDKLIIAAKPVAPQSIPPTVMSELQPDSSRPSVASRPPADTAPQSRAVPTTTSATTLESIHNKEKIVLTDSYFCSTTGDLKKAYTEACRLVAANRGDPEYEYQKATILIGLKKYSSAEQTLKNILADRPNNDKYNLARGYCYYRMGQIGVAKDYIDKAKFHNPTLPIEIVVGDQ
ncbi:MAG: caspase family protein, partial [Cyanobacteria bacterium]|nr:caspase family protein [Cyanobacteriota bacterium]